MTAHEYLSQAQRAEQRINADNEQLESLQEKILTISSMVISDVKTQSSRRRDPLGDLVSNTVDRIIACEERIASNMRLLMDIESAIHNVTDDESRAILKRFYLDRYTWPEIATERGYKRQRIYEARDVALAMVDIPITPRAKAD